MSNTNKINPILFKPPFPPRPFQPFQANKKPAYPNKIIDDSLINLPPKLKNFYQKIIYRSVIFAMNPATVHYILF